MNRMSKMTETKIEHQIFLLSIIPKPNHIYLLCCFTKNDWFMRILTLKRHKMCQKWTFNRVLKSCKYFWPIELNQFRFKPQEKGLSISCKVLRCFKSLQNRFEIFQLMFDANLEPILNTITNTYLDINRFKYLSKSYCYKSYRLCSIFLTYFMCCTPWF